MWSLSSARIIRYVLAPVLSLWVAGVGCVFGCEGKVASATNRRVDAERHSEHKFILAVSEHSCSSGKSPSKNPGSPANRPRPGGSSNETKPEAQRNGPAETKSTTLVTPGKPSSGMKDCPLAVSRTAVAAKSRGIEVKAAPAIAHLAFPSALSFDQTISLSSPRRFPNRGHTYLRCCVFLI